MSNALQLRNLEDLVTAHEWLFNQQREQKIDAKTADALNTTLKGLIHILGRLRMDYAKLLVQAQVKKITIPKGILPPIGGVAEK